MQVCRKLLHCTQILLFAVSLWFPAFVGAQTVEERAVADFYRDKTIRLVIGFTPGGGFDVAGRIIAPALGEQIPGRPKVVVVNMPGAGTLISANHVYNVMPQDGTVVGLMSQRLILRQAVQDPAVRFDTRRVQWIGSVSSGVVACVARKDRGFSTIRDLIDGPAVPVGGTGGTTSQAPLLLNRILGTNFKVIHGYPGVAQVKVALESGEIDGVCGGWSGLVGIGREWFEEPYRVSVLAVLGSPVPDVAVLKAAPRVEDLVKGRIERSLLDAFVAVSQAEKPFYFGPEVRRDRVEAVRGAFARALSDKTVVTRLDKAGEMLAVRTGNEVAALFKSAVEIPPEAIAELKKIIAF